MSEDFTNQMLEEYAKLTVIFSIVLIVLLSIVYILLIPQQVIPIKEDTPIGPKLLDLGLNAIIQTTSLLGAYVVSVFLFSFIRRINRGIEQRRVAVPPTVDNDIDTVALERDGTISTQRQHAIFTLLHKLIREAPEETIDHNELRHLANLGVINQKQYIDLGQLLQL